MPGQDGKSEGGPSAMSSSPDAHFIFLVHGFMGNSDELSYLEDVIKAAVAKSKSDTGDNVEVITHRVTCNNGDTFDGIEAGGKRVALEVQSFARDYFAKHNAKDDSSVTNFHASLSFIGYSLGGMYSRYAISVLPSEFELESGGSTAIALHPSTFCTAATPHLGMTSHTYVILPRSMEYILGYLFGKTGKDLFRFDRGKGATPNDLIYKMATDPAFLDPLSDFRNRISYINAFGTDFQVTTATAGMLSPFSSSQHHLSFDYDHWNLEEIGLDVLALETKPCKRPEGLQSSGTRSRKNDEALTMSLSLDSLGWIKVFVDCRKGMPGPSIRCICRRPRKEMVDSALYKKRAASERGENNGSVFESKELCKLMKKSEHWHLAPSGHFVLVAHSKTKKGAKKSAKGRPLVRQAAIDLVNDVREFELTSEVND